MKQLTIILISTLLIASCINSEQTSKPDFVFKRKALMTQNMFLYKNESSVYYTGAYQNGDFVKIIYNSLVQYYSAKNNRFYEFTKTSNSKVQIQDIVTIPKVVRNVSKVTRKKELDTKIMGYECKSYEMELKSKRSVQTCFIELDKSYDKQLEVLYTFNQSVIEGKSIVDPKKYLAGLIQFDESRLLQVINILTEQDITELVPWLRGVTFEDLSKHDQKNTK